jgi:hypothetical protein
VAAEAVVNTVGNLRAENRREFRRYRYHREFEPADISAGSLLVWYRRESNTPDIPARNTAAMSILNAAAMVRIAAERTTLFTLANRVGLPAQVLASYKKARMKNEKEV